jgi:quinol monooxygenase YgiN
MMGQFSIACYRPKPGKDAELLELTREHVPILRNEGLVTDRPAYAMRAKDGTIVEVFEWKSQEAIDSAHGNPEVLKLWQRYGAACDYVALSTLAEAQDMFAGFEAIF